MKKIVFLQSFCIVIGIISIIVVSNKKFDNKAKYYMSSLNSEISQLQNSIVNDDIVLYTSNEDFINDISLKLIFIENIQNDAEVYVDNDLESFHRVLENITYVIDSGLESGKLVTDGFLDDEILDENENLFLEELSNDLSTLLQLTSINNKYDRNKINAEVKRITDKYEITNTETYMKISN